jgi:dTMP kinase
MDLAERLERFDAVIDDLADLALDHILLIEGKNDAAALAELGISGDMFCVQSGGGPVKAAEYAWNLGRPAVILTDWDRRGDALADDLRRNLASLGVRYDDSVRRRLSGVCHPFCKDVENIHRIRAMLAGDEQI